MIIKYWMNVEKLFGYSKIIMYNYVVIWYYFMLPITNAI